GLVSHRDLHALVDDPQAVRDPNTYDSQFLERLIKYRLVHDAPFNGNPNVSYRRDTSCDRPFHFRFTHRKR
ncbi:MAG TPA: hypothetical protein VFS42_03595, partial [Burkholderiaceae bacterium]|nr:hypothetical protein [Burkholderiaceae bacterium]